MLLCPIIRWVNGGLVCGGGCRSRRRMPASTQAQCCWLSCDDVRCVVLRPFYCSVQISGARASDFSLGATRRSSAIRRSAVIPPAASVSAAASPASIPDTCSSTTARSFDVAASSPPPRHCATAILRDGAINDPDRGYPARKGIAPRSRAPRAGRAEQLQPANSLPSRQITEALKPTSLEVFNDSHLHAHHKAMQGVTSREVSLRVLLQPAALSLPQANHRTHPDALQVCPATLRCFCTNPSPAAVVTHTHGPALRLCYRVNIVSEAFRGKMQPARHRMIYSLMKDEMAREGGIHALQLRTRTPEEEQKAMAPAVTCRSE